MRRAFALCDLFVSLVAIFVLAAIVLAALSESRRHARLDEDLGSLQRFAAATQAYAADNENLQWGFTWQGGETYLMMQLDGEIAPTRMPDSDLGASGYQAVHLIRSLGGRIGDNGMPIVNGWLPHAFYSHLPLMDFLGEDPLARWTTSSADEVKQNWKDDPEDKFDNGFWLPLQPPPGQAGVRWPYSAGFELGSAAWDIRQSELAPEFNGKRVSQGGNHHTWLLPADNDLGGRPLSDVAHPAAKVQMYDTHQRHFGAKTYYFAFHDPEANARVPVLMYDASAAVRQSADANPGWNPNNPFAPCDAFLYGPAAWEPATSTGKFVDFCQGLYRWTRGGLHGVDFGALPLDTGQPDPGDCSL